MGRASAGSARSRSICVIAKMHGIDAYCTALPTTKNSSDSTPAARPMYAKSRIWKSGATSIGMKIHGREEAEERAVARQPADEEHARRASCQREGRAGARRSSTRSSDEDARSRRRARRGATHIAMSGQRRAAERRLADRVHAPGRREHPRDRAHPAGKSESGTRKPQTARPGTRAGSRARWRCGSARTRRRAASRAAPSEITVPASRARTASGCSMVSVDPEQQPAPERASRPCE